jgi:predicted RNA-binding Zn-ribbon protein involved in translation (DUF1610 family)
MAGRILEDSEFDKCIEGCAIGAKGRLIAHNAVLKVAARDGNGSNNAVAGDLVRDSIVTFLLAECGDQQTVRAIHTRKLAQRIKDKDDVKK